MQGGHAHSSWGGAGYQFTGAIPPLLHLPVVSAPGARTIIAVVATRARRGWGRATVVPPRPVVAIPMLLVPPWPPWVVLGRGGTACGAAPNSTQGRVYGEMDGTAAVRTEMGGVGEPSYQALVVRRMTDDGSRWPARGRASISSGRQPSAHLKHAPRNHAGI